MPKAITYQAGPRKSDLRTVLAEDVRRSTLLFPAGTFDVVQAKLLHGTTCRCTWWAEQLGIPESDDFVIPAEAVRQVREMQVGAIVRTHKGGN